MMLTRWEVISSTSLLWLRILGPRSRTKVQTCQQPVIRLLSLVKSMRTSQAVLWLCMIPQVLVWLVAQSQLRFGQNSCRCSQSQCDHLTIANVLVMPIGTSMESRSPTGPKLLFWTNPIFPFDLIHFLCSALVFR